MTCSLPMLRFGRRYNRRTVGVLERYGYQEIRTPILENTKVFTRGVGEVTDIVEKEMYSFTDSMNGDQLTLRPECTSAVVRAVNEHNLLYGATQRLWYMGDVPSRTSSAWSLPSVPSVGR